MDLEYNDYTNGPPGVPTTKFLPTPALTIRKPQMAPPNMELKATEQEDGSILIEKRCATCGKVFNLCTCKPM